MSEKRDRVAELAARLLEDDGRQPADPFESIPRPERATCDRDFIR